jgi:type IV pilus assembly protein PilV
VIRDYLPRRAAGFTLLEVLVAMVVLSIGLLGLSGMQTSSLRNNHSAFLRSQATVVSNDIIDRMRANRDSAVLGDYDIAYTDAAPSPGCSGGSCASAEAVADTDLNEWRAYVARLPGGQGEIDVVQESVTVGGESVSIDVAEVKVRWGDARDGTQLEIVTRSQI